ncbi:MAG: ABC transporter ATP-binding protein [Planctomycetes bacterium]|nr:ABC transporter ATP-binding protein [Planctomycetota bacterium]
MRRVETAFLVAEGLGFEYREPVLVEFSVLAAAGTLTILAGTNGAGKSTALSLLAGEFTPRHGHVRICGGDPRKARTRREFFFLAETARDLHWLSAREAVDLHRDLYGLSKTDGLPAVEALSRLGLGSVAGRRLSGFSKGMQRRVELAAAVACDRPVWLFDEPESGLDPEGRLALQDLLLEAKARGRTLLVSTHLGGTALRGADQLIVLRRGRTRFQGTVQEAMRVTGCMQLEVRDSTEALCERLKQTAQEAGAQCAEASLSAAGLQRLMAPADGSS